MSRRLSTSEYVLRVRELRGEGYVILSEYSGAKKPVTVKHLDCGRVYETKAENLYTGGCLDCGYGKMKKAQRKPAKEFATIVEDKGEGDYLLLGEYVNNKTKLPIKHLVCGNKYETTPSNFNRGRRCPFCVGIRISKGVTLTHSEYLDTLKVPLEDDFKILREYENARTKLKVLHETCGRVFEISPSKLSVGQRCSACSRSSSGEQRIASWLKDNGLEFYEEHTFPDLRGKNLLRYDFAIVDDLKEVRVLVEYNGLQHYEPIDFFGGVESFERQVKRDEMKLIYAQTNNIPMIIIRYDEDIEEELSKLIPR